MPKHFHRPPGAHRALRSDANLEPLCSQRFARPAEPARGERGAEGAPEVGRIHPVPE
jgi:hypothetical protein